MVIVAIPFGYLFKTTGADMHLRFCFFSERPRPGRRSAAADPGPRRSREPGLLQAKPSWLWM